MVSGRCRAGVGALVGCPGGGRVGCRGARGRGKWPVADARERGASVGGDV